VVESVVDGHTAPGLNLQKPEDKVQSVWLAKIGLSSEKHIELAVLEQQPISVVLRRVAGQEQRLRRQQVVRAPTQTPRVNLGRHVWHLLVQLRRAEGFADQSPELDGHLRSLFVDLENHSLARIADLHLELALRIHMKQHVLQGHVLHGDLACMQICHTLGGLPDEALSMSFVEPSGFQLQRLQQVATSTEFEHHVEAPFILKVLLRLHNVLVAPHQIRKSDLAEGNLAELYGGGFLSLVKLALVQNLDRKVPPRRQAFRLVDTPEESTLESADKLVRLLVALDFWANTDLAI